MRHYVSKLAKTKLIIKRENLLNVIATFKWSLKLVSVTNFYFSPNDSPSKTMKDVFYFIQKALFVLKIFKFLYFHLSLIFFLSAIALELDSR